MSQPNRLSHREWEVVKLLLQGRSNKQIAASLAISERTVEFHLKNIYAKYQVGSRIELILVLGKTTGVDIKKLGDSTVDRSRESGQTRGRLNPWLDWAALLRYPFGPSTKEIEMKRLMNFDSLLMIVAGLLILFVNWLAFHDFQEVHTVRDWLMLAASLLVLLSFAKALWERYSGRP